MKYTLIAEDEYGGSTTTREFTADYLPDVLSEMELFLRGAGFFFTGNLDFVDETENSTDDFDIDPDWDDNYSDHGGGSTLEDYPELMETKSQYYFDSKRNK